jgi:hypothetical protein
VIEEKRAAAGIREELKGSLENGLQDGHLVIARPSIASKVAPNPGTQIFRAVSNVRGDVGRHASTLLGRTG